MKTNHRSRQGFTLVEVLVVIGIIVVLAGILAPVGKGMVTRSRAVNCSRNLREIGLAAMMYAGDNNMTLPVTSHQRRSGGKSWTLSLQPYTSTTLTFKCHEDEAPERPYTYVLNDFLTPNPAGAPNLNYSVLARLDRPNETFMFAEAASSYQNSDHFHFTAYHGDEVPIEVFETQVAVSAHGDKSNYLFADGHVEALSREQVTIRLKDDHSAFVDPSVKEGGLGDPDDDTDTGIIIRN